MKKAYVILALIIILLVAMSMITCDNGTTPTQEPIHIHQWNDWVVTTPATCITEGVETRICRLDPLHKETQNLEINSNAHDWGSWEGTATCTVGGISTRVCNDNPEHIDEKNGVPLGHIFLIYTYDGNATCYADGTKTAKCERVCGADDTIINLGSLGHEWSDWTQIDAPTCSIQGLEFRSCNRNCGVSDEGRPVSALGHTPNTETGFCTVCDELGYNVGDIGPGGGIIFLTAPMGFTFYTSAADTVGIKVHFLEASPVDLGRFRWSTRTEAPFINIPGTSGTTSGGISISDIGVGMKNTALILELDPFAPAAKTCSDYISNGKSDWFLPSTIEMYYLHSYINERGGSSYWTSSQSWESAAYYTLRRQQGGTVWITDFGQVLKNTEFSVRAIRAF